MADSVTVRIPKTVYDKACIVADEKGMTLKEAVRHMAQEGDYDV